MTTPLRREDLKRNELGDAIEAGVHFAEDHLRTILWVAGAALGVALVVWGAFLWSGSRESRANAALAGALRVASAPVVASGAKPADDAAPSFASESARDARARELFAAVVDQYGSTASGASARLWLAEKAFESGDRSAARQQWMAYLSKAPEGALAVAAQRNLWALDRAEGKGEDALREIESDLDRGGRKVPADVLLFELATTQQSLGRASEAASAFSRLLEEHPGSPFADEARRQSAARGAA